jgi:GMP synthase-like glutamine amidotransferase
MSRRLLYLSNGPKRVSVARLDRRFAGLGFEVDIRWAYRGEFPQDVTGYAGIFLSGSPHGAYEDVEFIHREHALIRQAASLGVPMLGICFGSQILASALCGREQVFRRTRCEVGYFWLDVHERAAGDKLMHTLRPRARMFVWHNDEVRADHPDMDVLASSEQCPNQIWRHRAVPAWGIQGHPEVNRAQFREWSEEVRERLERDGADVAALNRAADDAEPAKTVFANFAALCLGGGAEAS